jgi:hypothetical protein
MLAQQRLAALVIERLDQQDARLHVIFPEAVFRE